jgi:MinD-like ATPase involved in chromosome partitioning or flagellar assembly
VQLEASAPAKVIAYRQLFMEGVCTMCLVANGVTDANQDAVIQDFAKNIEKHLGLHMPVIGSLPFEPDMKKVESTGEPFVSKFPHSKYAEEMNGIVETIAAIQTAKK